MQSLQMVTIVVSVVVVLVCRAVPGFGQTHSDDAISDEVSGVQTIIDSIGSLLLNSALKNSTKCDVQLQAALVNSSSWAFPMLDAWGKIPSGIFEGNFYDLGSFEECRKFSYDTNNETLGEIRGQYCLLSIPFNLDSNRAVKNGAPIDVRGFPSNSNKPALRIGTCFPDTCDGEYLSAWVKNVTATMNFTSDLKITCTESVPDMGAKEIVAIVIFSLIACLIVLSTAYEVFALANNREPNPSLAMGSLYTSGIKLFQMAKRPPAAAQQKSELIDCLNGIRVLSMVWIIFCHNYLMLIASPLDNAIAIYDWIKSYHSMLVAAATVSVDSFFVLSGMLVCWSIMKELEKKRKLNLPLMYVHRYLRLTPALAALVLLSATLLKYFGSGPFWSGSAVATLSDPCEKYWWSALLYVQNYVNPTEICLGHTWYLSVDMQLYVLSPLIIYPLWRWGRKILIAIVILILLSMGCVFATYRVNDLRLAYVAAGQKANRMALTYYPTHIRMAAWLVGVILGYVLHQTKARRVRIGKIVVFVGWLASGVAMAAILFGDYPLQQPDTYSKHPATVDAIYESTNRVIWACCISWIVFACVNGYGGPVNSFLSLSAWQPLGRLSYSMYLLHFPTQVMMTGTLKSTAHFNDIDAVHKFWGDFGFTVTLATVWCLLFESPIVGLEKLLFGTRRKPSDSKALVKEQHSREIVPRSTTI
ncbi:nose resistant to fluoxetine protein 6-like [Malaya genurostris]|uniref:nose resistant to fluoxetine protein 6-like n=1 Tax=Malaya genurostris TaxID=325434 RepID=UPI0026F3D0F5|nr:nose resistant to fluoxetine protein 6-like [Malaya genurostris]